MRSAVLSCAFSFAFFALLVPGCGGSSSPDCSKDPAACACTSDSSCAGATPRCDTRTGQCVPCLPTNDNCPVTKHCVSTGPSYACVTLNSCTAPADCPSEAGTSPICCLGVCTDGLSDNTHCGVCGNTCGAVPNGVGGCLKGACGVVGCNKGFGDCDLKPGNGCEVDLTITTAHCGICGEPCKANPNTTVSCVNAQCQSACIADFADCDNNPANGCETSVTTNPNNCGACGKVCAALPNTTAVACVNSACVVSACKTDFVDCNKQPGDGCESDTKNDPVNCGACGRKCPAVMNAAPGCSSGNCGVGKCNPGFDDCDKNVLNGCEQDLLSDARNCGACGTVCTVANGSAVCQGGKCGLQACNQGWADCDNNPANGCETNLTRDLQNCGMCANVCPVPPNATAACSSGVCGIGSCNYGRGDCNNSIVDGCETDLLTTLNCGACNRPCANVPNATIGCPNAACVIASCNVGFADCDMKVGTGCEINTTNDPKNCGACGFACNFPNGAGSCVNGMCTLASCNAGYADCNGKSQDGCEQDIGTDAKNCGACGKACAAPTATCVKGACACAGSPGVICNNVCIDGGTDPNNCGKCGNVCPNNAPLCSNGVCVACGNDCWGATGCLTAKGKCIMFTCRAGNAGANFCNGCKGWKEVSYDQWMNQGYCADVTARYRQSDGAATKCGNQNLSCCNGSANCNGGDNAWHFWNAQQNSNYYVGPALGNINDVNCSTWNNVDNSTYTRITVCEK